MIQFQPIGFIKTSYIDKSPNQPIEGDKGHYLVINKEYEQGLLFLDKFKYIYVLYYLNKLNDKSQINLTVPKNDKNVGIFATRTPLRPNPIGLSVVRITKIEGNHIFISGIDAFDGTPLLDIKPYIKGLDCKEDANFGWLESNDKSEDVVYLYTDGACSGNPGPGGYAAIIKKGNLEYEITGYKPKTTNNQMELLAVIEGLKQINKNEVVKLVSDSNYVLQGLTEWLGSWKKKGWKTASNKPVKNKELWRKLDYLVQDYYIEIEKVKGHSGHHYNERVDTLAREQIKNKKG